MSAAAELLPALEFLGDAVRVRALGHDGGAVGQLVRAEARYDAAASDFIDPLQLWDVALFCDGSVLRWDYHAHVWEALDSPGAYVTFGGVRQVRYLGGAWVCYRRRGQRWVRDRGAAQTAPAESTPAGTPVTL